MSTCRGCGMVLGRDCFNEQDCMWIAQDMEMRAQQAAQDIPILSEQIAESEEGRRMIYGTTELHHTDPK